MVRGRPPSHTTCVALPFLESLANIFQKGLNLQNQQLKRGKKWTGIGYRLASVVGELRASQNEVGNLRSALILEKNKRREAEKNTSKLKEDVDCLKSKCLEMEFKIAELKVRSTSTSASTSKVKSRTPSPPMGNEVLDTLNELIIEVHTKFEDWNGRQGRLQEEVKSLKEGLQQQQASPSRLLHPVPKAQPKSNRSHQSSEASQKVPKKMKRHGLDYARKLHCLCGKSYSDNGKQISHLKYYENKSKRTPARQQRSRFCRKNAKQTMEDVESED